MPRLRQLKRKQQEAGVAVDEFKNDEPLGTVISDGIEMQIAKCDCALVVISASSIVNPAWIEREIGLAITLKSDRRCRQALFVALALINHILPHVEPVLRETSIDYE
jgi:hypothetical protein